MAWQVEVQTERRNLTEWGEIDGDRHVWPVICDLEKHWQGHREAAYIEDRVVEWSSALEPDGWDAHD